MSGQTGFNYEVMISRLHGGLCAFQSLRAHRRQREQGVAPASTTEVRATSEERVPPEPVPLFGNLNGLFGVPAVPSTPATTASAPPVTPPGAPPPSAEELRPPQVTTTPAPTASTLKLPPPMPPPRLGLIYGGHAPAPEPVAATEPATTTPRTPIHDAPQDAAQAPEAPSAAAIIALLDARAQTDLQRLEKANADHRVAIELLLREHRDGLRAQGEADVARTTQMLREHRDELHAQREANAARTTQLLREVLAEHRAELAQQYTTDSHAVAGGTGELRAALLEQASLQREANADLGDQISALTTIVADLGHTVGMLAVAAAHKAQSHLPTRSAFAPPPRVEPPHVDPIASTASPQSERVASTVSPHVELATARVGLNAPTSSETAPTAANQPSARPSTPPLRTRSEAAERTRLHEALEDDSDDDIGAIAGDDDDPVHRRRLPPLTTLEKPDQEHDDDV